MSHTDARSEETRLTALDELQLLDTPPEASFDSLAQLAATLCATPMALVTCVARDHWWIKAAHGLNRVLIMPRDDSFCVHAIAVPTEMCVIADADSDARFNSNPLVTGTAGVRFYAGVPLLTNGVAIGTLCVMDTQPRQLIEDQSAALRALAKQAEALLELRRVSAELRAAHAKLEQGSDALTGLLNRRSFEARLGEEIPRARRHERPLALLLVGVDEFETYQDSFGRQAADELLRAVGGILKDATRASDVAARLGGEEFVIALPETDPDGAIVMAERLRSAVVNASWHGGRVTVCIGIATLSNTAPDGDALLELADIRLYQARQRGRNHIEKG